MNVTLVIPSRNNLKYVKFAYNSIRTNLGNDVEVILLDDASTDGTWEWMKSVESEKTKTYRNKGPERIGHTVLYDIGAKMARNEVFGIFHADMIATPNYLKNMMKHVKRGTVVSGTRIEPPLHPPGPEKIVENFGLEPEEFQMTDFLSFVKIQEDVYKDKTTAGIFAPWIMYVEDFFAIGGHDKRVFAPMELEDSDLFNRFKLAGYQFIQSRDAFVYHMTCRGSRFKDGVKIIQEIPLGGGHIWKRPKDSMEYSKLRYERFRDWWRKWHMDVLHDEMMMPKINPRYNLGFVIKNCQKQLLELLEPWCDSIYIENKDLIKTYIEEQYRIYDSKFNLEKRIKHIDEYIDNDVIIKFDQNEYLKQNPNTDIALYIGFPVKNEDPKFYFIKNLGMIIQNSGEIGDFEYGIFKITIKSMESYEKNLIHADDPWYLSKLKQGI